MIYDCFTFFNELELLELRLHELADTVDKFVLVEATQTHTNRPKPLHYWENRERFSRFHDRIIHVAVADLPQSVDAWIPENFQRNCISRGLTQCRPEDWILVSDVDEIPRATTVDKICRENPYEYPFPKGFATEAISRPALRLLSAWKFSRGWARRNNPFIFKFQQSNHLHFLNCVVAKPVSSANWYGTRMLRFRDFISAQEVRESGSQVVPGGGWHFTSMGGVSRIQEKIQSYAHQELNKPDFIESRRLANCLEEGKSIFNPAEEVSILKLDDSFPRYILENRETFAGWIKST